MWAKKNVPGGIYYDITWVGYIGETPRPDIGRSSTRSRMAAMRP